MMMSRAKPWVFAAFGALVVTGCNREPAGPAPKDQTPVGLPSQTTQMAYTLEPAKSDFPYGLHVPPRRPGQWYQFNRQETLERVVNKVSGECTKPAWLMAKEFFDRHWDLSRELLVERLDEKQRTREGYDHAENLVNVMGRNQDGAFADVLVRAAVHTHPGIRTAAYRALRNGGNEAAVLKIGQAFAGMDKNQQVEWVKAAAAKLSDKHLFPLFRQMMTQAGYAHLQNHVFEFAMKLPNERAAKLFEPIWRDVPEDLQVYIAGIFHAIGDGRGTTQIKHALKPPVKIINRKIVAIEGARKGDITPFVDELLALTLEDDPRINVLVTLALTDVKGENVTDGLITLTDRSKPFQVRQAALIALKKRGVTTELDELVELIKTSPSNNRFRNAVADLVGAKYGKAVPVLFARCKENPEQEVYFIREMCKIDAPETFAAMKEIFLRPEYRFKGWARHTNVTFLGVQLSNLQKQAPKMLTFATELPKADYRRRAAMMKALANLAGAYPDAEYAPGVYEMLRKIAFDREELPQLRILALDYMRKSLKLDDVTRFQESLSQESKGMRMYLNDFLFEFF